MRARRRRSRIRGGGAAARRDPPPRADRSRRAATAPRPAAAARPLDRRAAPASSAREMARAKVRARSKAAGAVSRPKRHRSDGAAEPPIPRAALVTGAAQADRPRHRPGAGRGRLGRRGASPRLARRRPRRSSPRSSAGGGRAVALAADLARRGRGRAAVPRAAAALGPLGCLVNNASVFENDTVADRDARELGRASRDQSARALRADAGFRARCCRPTASGAIINLLDERVWNLTPYFVSYTVSKAGLWTLTQTMALALAPRIRVNGIGPGPTLPSPRQSAEQFRAPVRARCRCGAAPAPRRSPPRCASSSRRRR